jgi:ubiquinone/menaquinone biosynthesis C-methylase UbiE
MNDPRQASAYAYADFTEPHENFVDLLEQSLAGKALTGCVLDLGCGPGDITRRVAKRFSDATFHAVDGAEAMLELGRRMTSDTGLDERIQFVKGVLPHCDLPNKQYDAIISNSLLHHLHNPMVLWRTILHVRKSGAPIFIMDLMRPKDKATAQRMVEEYCGTEPEVLKRDFYHSLLAAFTPEEVCTQLRDSGLNHLQVNEVSDRHLTVTGTL